MKKIARYTTAACLSLLLLFLLTVMPYADMGPKRSVRVQFENMGDVLCYGTLLSAEETTGPQSAWKGGEKDLGGELDEAIWDAFAAYQDADGYYFVQIGWQVNESKELAWTYYPPNPFKILLYFPETGNYAVSDSLERYAFDTYYTANIKDFDFESVRYNDTLSSNYRIETYRAFDYQNELLALAARIVLTILIEMVVALAFGFRKKGQLCLLLIVNTATQILLNVLLYLVDYYDGPFAFAAMYVLLELLVFAIEAIIYCRVMNRWAERPRGKVFYTLYALTANAVSFRAGLFLAQILPDLF